MGPEAALLRAENIEKRFPVRTGLLRRNSGEVRAVDGVSFTIGAGETVGLVGESGCGKTTLARVLLRLEEAQAGAMIFDGEDALALEGEGLRRYRRGVQMIFQDPLSSLNPLISAEAAIIRAWNIHADKAPRAERRERARALLEMVGLNRAQAQRFPHQLSGGQRQRVAIARALALSPRLVVCDEPVSALDVSIQAQVLALLQDLQDRLKVAYLFISHDLAVVRRISRRVLVMYLGRIVESGPASDVFERPAHPYTEALLAAIPGSEAGRRTLETRRLLQGDPPNPASPPSGCRFRTRCPRAAPLCAQTEPLLATVSEQHAAACHFPSRF
jgi:oligopeptide transport system ATP-binding protein